MRLWLIRLSPITSASLVRLTLKISIFALITSQCIVQLVLWGIVVSDIPLVLSWPLLVVLYRYYSVFGVMPKVLIGYVDIDTQAQEIISSSRESYHQFSLIYSSCFIVFYGHGRRWLLWRDSCDEFAYRQLVMQLKREQQGSHD